VPPTFTHAVNKEIGRVEDQVQSFSAIIELIDRKRYKIHHLHNFRRIVVHCKKLLEKNLRNRLTSAITGLEPEEEQIKELDKFRIMIRRLTERLYNIAVNSLEIPHELYFLCDNLLEYYDEKPQYVISVSDEIALQPFTFILQNVGKFEEEYFFRDFYDIISKENFYIVQIVSEIASTISSLDWVVVLHEAAHMVCSEKAIEDRYFPGVSMYDALITLDLVHRKKLAPTAAGVQLAAKKVYASEFLADFVVTKCYGPTFGWRFARKWVDLKPVFEPSRTLETHPTPGRRIEAIIGEVRKNMKNRLPLKLLRNEAAELLKKTSQSSGEKSEADGITVESITQSVLRAIAKVKKEINRNAKFVLTEETIKKSIMQSSLPKLAAKHDDSAKQKLQEPDFSKLFEKIVVGLLEGKPVVVDPPVIYYILILNFARSPDRIEEIEAKTENAQVFREFIADLVRLYYVQSQFLQSKNTKQELVKELADMRKIYPAGD
jgi:hypothetical protein